MINIFKDLRNKYLATSVGGGIVIALLMSFTGARDLITYIVVFVWAIFMGWVFTKKAGNRARNLSALRNNCHLSEYIAKYSEILSKLREGTPADAMVRLNLAAGYLDMGDNVSAANLMRSIDVKPGKRNGKPIAAIYHTNYSLIFLRAGDYENAEKAIAACRSIVGEGVPQVERERIEWFCRVREAQIDVARGDMAKVDHSLEVFENYLRRVATPLERSAATYWLARVWNLKGDREGELHYLRMAAQEGGETVYAREARELLAAYAED